MIIAAAIGIVVYVVPTFQETQEVKTEEQELDRALANARRLQERRAELTTQFNSFTDEELEAIDTLVPDNIDNVKLIIELDALASRHGLAIQNINVVDDSNQATNEELALVAEQEYGTIELDFTVTGPYERFVSFVEDVERSLRLIDVQSIAFQSIAQGANYQYSLRVRTYWLR
jgi:Tfp pilus assembly protein PilO